MYWTTSIDKSLISTKNEIGLSHEPWGTALLSSLQEDIDWLVRTLDDLIIATKP